MGKARLSKYNKETEIVPAWSDQLVKTTYVVFYCAINNRTEEFVTPLDIGYTS